jgi:hypothetical protein
MRQARGNDCGFIFVGYLRTPAVSRLHRMMNEYGAVGGVRINREDPKPAPESLFPLHS